MAGADDVELDWWPADRSSELQAFIAAEWQPGHVLAGDESLLRWQHPRNERELSVVRATVAGELAGILGVIPVEVGVRGDRRAGAWLTTWFVVPAARAQGVGLRLLDFVLARHDFVGTIGGNATTMRILGALRFHTCASVPRWVRPIDRDALVRLVGEGALSPPATAAAPTTAQAAARAWDPAVAALWDETWPQLARGLVGTWRDARYIDWRYADHPRFRYRIRVALDTAGAATALVVHRVEDVRGADATVVRIVEALGEPAPLASLLAGAVAEGHERGAAFADFYCTTGRFASALEANGFVRAEGLVPAFPSRFQPLEAEPKPLTAALHLRDEGDSLAGEDVYFTRSDCDQDRPN